MELCNYHHNLILLPFCPPQKGTLCPLQAFPAQGHPYPSVSIDWPFLGISYKWNHAIHIMFFSVVYMSYFIPFHSQLVVHFTALKHHLVYLFISRWTFELSLPFGCKRCCGHLCTSLCVNMPHIYSGCCSPLGTCYRLS